MDLRAALALLLAGCGGAVGGLERPITNGTEDDGDHAVAALLDASGEAYCTGTLIAREAVLTAAHCLEGEPPATVYFGPSPAGPGMRVPVWQVRLHPAYDPDTQAEDVGIIVLAARAGGVEPAQVWARPFDESFLGKPIRLVGFGRTGAFDARAARKRYGTSRIRSYTDRDFSFSAAPSQTCFGDSGGPSFAEVGGIDYVIGITSSGDVECMSGGTNARVDAFTVDFIQKFLGGAGTSVVGGCSAAPRGRDRVALPLCVLLAVGLARRRARVA